MEDVLDGFVVTIVDEHEDGDGLDYFWRDRGTGV